MANIDSHSNCSSNTQPNCNSNSNSGSVRSLLTEKLRQFAQDDLEDPENKHERLIIQGNLMKELSKCSKASKPMLVSRKFEDLSEPFSMQNKRHNEGEQNWPRKRVERVHSQRTILGEIYLS